MNNKLLIFLFYFILSLSFFTHAQNDSVLSKKKPTGSIETSCLKLDLASVFEKSKLNSKELLQIAYDKLGYGHNPTLKNLNFNSVMDKERLLGKETSYKLINFAINSSFSQMNNDPVLKGIDFIPHPDVESSKISESQILENFIVAQKSEKKLCKNKKIEECRAARTEKRKWRQILINYSGWKTVADAIYTDGLNPGLVFEEFWFNHFNVSAKKSFRDAASYKAMIRSKLCGNFLEMLISVSKHPAMLFYLDNHLSIKPGGTVGKRSGLNENFARELLELHTLGEGPGKFYNQKDVKQVALTLTGWSIKNPKQKKSTRDFMFKKKWHDTSVKKVMNNSYQSGLKGGELLLADLVKHPQTKMNICKKLTLKLYGSINDTIVKGCVKAYGDKGDFSSIYSSLLNNDLFWNKTLLKSVFKNPFEYFVSLERSLGHSKNKDISLIKRVYNGVKKSGLYIRNIGAPTGYSLKSQDWVKSSFLLQIQEYFPKRIHLKYLSHNQKKVKYNKIYKKFVKQDLSKSLDFLDQKYFKGGLSLPLNNTVTGLMKSSLTETNNKPVDHVSNLLKQIFSSPNFLLK